MSLVSFVHVRESQYLGQAIADALDLIQYRFAKDIRRVVIKPNMCYYWDYSTGQTTDPNFVGTLVDVIRDKVSHDIDFSIVESDASAMKCKYSFKFLGYEKMAKHRGIALVNLSEDESERIRVTSGEKSYYFNVPRTIQKADLRVNVPKIKSHVKTKVSCALKNIYGCNPYPNKFKYHRKLDEVIVALNKVLKFELVIVDGIIVSGKTPLKMNLVMASRDPVAIDVAAAKIVGVDPRSVGHVMLARKEGVGNTSLIAKGTALEYFKKRYPREGPMYKIMNFGYNLVTTLGLNSRLGLTD